MTTSFVASAQTPVPMASQPGLTYTENFADIANWSNGFTAGAGANRFGSVAVNTTGTIPSGTRITTATTSFTTSTTGGVQKGTSQTATGQTPTQSIVLLSTGATDNSSSTAIDFFMDFTGVNAGTLSFDWATVFNSTGDRKGSLRVYASTDGSTFTELTGAQVLNFTNNIASSGSVTSVSLPSSFNNSSTARLRFYYHNGVGGSSGSRPKISIDNLTVTATSAPAGNTIAVASGTAAAEPATAGSFTINFSAATTASTDINYNFTGNASFGTDYNVSFSSGTPANPSTSTGTLTVPSGTSSVTVTVTPIDDASVEGTENITLTLSAPTGGYTLGNAASSINLTDNDVAPTVSVAAGNAGAEPSTNGTFNITLSSPAPVGGVTVTYTLGGTATSPDDYTDLQSGSVTIPEGASSGVATMNIVDNGTFEPTETISITLTGASNGYSIATGTASINVTDNDLAPLTPISLTGSYFQDFNTLASTGSATTNPLSLQGWHLNESGGGGRDNEGYAVDNGGSGTGDTYSYGITGSSDRALGSIASGTLQSSYGAYFTNNTGTAITRLRIAYVGEKWRLGTATSSDKHEFQISTNATNVANGTWTDVNELDLAAPNVGTAGSKDGNDPANRSLIDYSISGLNIPNGSSFFIRWNDIDNGGADDGLAVDSLTVEANPVDNTAPVATGLNPADNSTNVAISSTATITFSETIQKGTGTIEVRRSSDNSLAQSIDVATGVTTSGASASFQLSGLTAGSEYYILVHAPAFTDPSGNNFAGISDPTTWSFNTGALLFSANFQTCGSSLSDGFKAYSQTGALTWECTTFGRTGNGVQMNGFAGGTNVPNIDWLISPSINLTGTNFPILSFYSRTAFNGEPLQLKISTNYSGTGDPNLATWTDLNGRFPEEASDVWTLSNNINLSAYKQPNVHIAFVYESSNDDGARWTLDDIAIDNSSTPPPASLTTGTSDMQFGFVAAGASADKTFTFTGNDITDGVTVTSTGNFLVSKDGVTFSNSITYTQSEANNVPQTVTVRFAPSANDRNFNGNITVATSSLTSTVTAKGTSIDPIKTLEVVNWNIEWFGSAANGPTNDAQQEANVRTILTNINADVYGLTEIVSEARLASLTASMPGYSYVISNYGSHTNTSANPPGALAEAQKLAFIYRTSVFSNVTTTPLFSQGINSSADLSNPAYNYFASGRFPYMMTADVNLNGQVRTVRFILVHGKANTSPTQASYDRRKAGSDTLHHLLSTTFANDNVIMLGDLNDDLDSTITAGISPALTSYIAFTSDGANFRPLTLPLSQAGRRSTVSYNDVIDHVIVSNEMSSYYMNSSANILSDVTGMVTNYGSTTSDHYPVFTRFAFDPTIVLPVKVQTFNAVKAGNTVRVTWSTSEELNAREFQVERSADGRSYTSIGRIAAANSRTGASYQLTDQQPGRGDNFYRLRAVDIDNRSELSRVIKINFSKAYTFTVTPNPARSKFTVSVTNNTGQLQLEVVDMNGRVVKTQLLTSTNNTVDVQTLQKGLYLVRLKGDAGVYTEKLVIE